MRLNTLCSFVTCCFGVQQTLGVSWGLGTHGNTASPIVHHNSHGIPTGGANSHPPLPNAYAIALQELKELESEPLCHRNAARLLVGNCQLIDGKDEATVMMDSGRLARDFVDSFAASLAICDLERGSFVIPISCSKFQESTLSKLSISERPELHVSTAEIDRCLEGLAQSDSAWNTWVSYRHKAVRFCDAARVYNEKDRDIRIYQKLTKILSQLTNEAGSRMEAQLQSVKKALEITNEKLDNLEPTMKKLKTELAEIENMTTNDLPSAVQSSYDLAKEGTLSARALQELLVRMMENLAQSTEIIAKSQEQSLAVAKRMNMETDRVINALAATMASAVSIHHKLESSHLRALEIAGKQEKIEAGMNKLEITVQEISSEYEYHDRRLKEVQAKAGDILNALDATAISVVSLQGTIQSSLGTFGLWPYIYCPLVSLLLGSYGLPPSTMRNIGLILLGEGAGLLVSFTSNYIQGVPGQPITSPKHENTTLDPITNTSSETIPVDVAELR